MTGIREWGCRWSALVVRGMTIRDQRREGDMDRFMSQEERMKEITEGGTLSPCPMCGLPRCERSNYIRCSKCGVNWLNENRRLDRYLDRNPCSAQWDEFILDAFMGTLVNKSAKDREEAVRGFKLPSEKIEVLSEEQRRRILGDK